MTVDSIAKLFDASAHLIGSFIWPVCIVLSLYLFGEPIKEFIASLSEFSFKGGGFEASAKRKTEVAAALGAAIAKQPDQSPQSVAYQTRLVSGIVDAVSARSVREASKTTILWVDDHPENNISERHALEALGVRFVLATSTDAAISEVRKQDFQVIISDLGRASDSMAGLTLLGRLREAGNKVPFIIYAGARGLTIRDEAKSKGAFAVTNRPDELFSLVVSAIERSKG